MGRRAHVPFHGLGEGILRYHERTPVLSQQFASDDFRTCTESVQFAICYTPGQRSHAAVCGRIQLVGIDKPECFPQRTGHSLWCLDAVAGHVDGTHHHFFPSNEFEELHGDMRVVAFERDDVDVGLLQLWEGPFILAPLLAQCLLPVCVGLDAVAVADMDGCLAPETFDGTVPESQRPNHSPHRRKR